MSQAIQGAGQGAATGAQIGGGWGALIGGGIGLLTGLGSDRKVKEAQALVRKANALRTNSTILRSFAEQRTLLRQANLVRMSALAASAASGAELESSGAQGIQASIRTQSYDNFLLGQSILNEQLDANQFEAKASRKLQQAGEIMSLFGGGMELAQLIPNTSGTNQPVQTANQPSDLMTFGDRNLVNSGGIQTFTGNFNGG